MKRQSSQEGADQSREVAFWEVGWWPMERGWQALWSAAREDLACGSWSSALKDEGQVVFHSCAEDNRKGDTLLRSVVKSEIWGFLPFGFAHSRNDNRKEGAAAQAGFLGARIAGLPF